jgi:hypothetical protein
MNIGEILIRESSNLLLLILVVIGLGELVPLLQESRSIFLLPAVTAWHSGLEISSLTPMFDHHVRGKNLRYLNYLEIDVSTMSPPNRPCCMASFAAWRIASRPDLTRMLACD